MSEYPKCTVHRWHSERTGDIWQMKCMKCGCLNDDAAPMLGAIVGVALLLALLIVVWLSFK